jgi:hypothetical protein
MVVVTWLLLRCSLYGPVPSRPFGPAVVVASKCIIISFFFKKKKKRKKCTKV